MSASCSMAPDSRRSRHCGRFVLARLHATADLAQGITAPELLGETFELPGDLGDLWTRFSIFPLPRISAGSR